MILFKALYVKLTLWMYFIFLIWSDTRAHLVVKQHLFSMYYSKVFAKADGPSVFCRMESVKCGIMWNYVEFVNKPFNVRPQNIFYYTV